jgi:hypothetical protein
MGPQVGGQLFACSRVSLLFQLYRAKRCLHRNPFSVFKKSSNRYVSCSSSDQSNLYIAIALVIQQYPNTLDMLFVDSHVQCCTTVVVKTVNIGTFFQEQFGYCTLVALRINSKLVNSRLRLKTMSFWLNPKRDHPKIIGRMIKNS